MLTLHFQLPLSREELHVGRVPFFQITRDALVAGPDDRRVAQHEHGTWRIEDHHAVVLAVNEPVVLRFRPENGAEAEKIGPLEHVRIVDGAIRGGPAGVTLLARFDEESQSWVRNGAAYESVHFEPAA